MIIPSHSFGVIASGRPRVVAASSGITPTPTLNWTSTLFCSEADLCQDYTEERILGINQTITLTFTVTANSGVMQPSVYYRKDTTPVTSYGVYCDTTLNFDGLYSSPIPEGKSQSLPNQLFDGSSLITSSITVNPGDYLSFNSYGANPFPLGSDSVTIRINNQTDGNAVLDTITFTQPAI